VAPTSRPETQKFHIIQPVVVYQKKAVVLVKVEVISKCLQVLEQDATMTVDDGLWFAGRTR